MAGIPLPALDIKQQQSDPLESYGRLVQLKSLLQNQQFQQQMQPLQMQQQKQATEAGALDLQQKQRDAADQQVLQQAISASPGATIHDILPQLAGKVSPRSFMAYQKMDRDSQAEYEKLVKEKGENAVMQHQQYQQIYDNVMNLPDDQVAAKWPQIAQAVNSVPGGQLQLDPQQPKSKQELASFGPMLSLGDAYLQKAIAKQEQQAKLAGTQAETAKNTAQAAKDVAETQRIGKTPGVDVPYSPAVQAQKKELKASVNLMTSGDASDIADAIASGDQPPTLQGLYRNAGPVRAELARRGVPLAKMETDWKATQRFMGSLNSTQQVRLRQAISTASDSLDKIEDLYNQLQAAAPTGGFKAWNRAVLTSAKQLPGKAGSLATNLDAQIADLTSELGNVYMGGNSPTDHSLSLAAKNLSGDWNKETFEDALKQARQNIQIRNNSIIHSQPVTGGGENMYAPQQPASAAPAPAKSAAPISLDEARAYLQKAGGDKDKARALAKADGRSF